MDELKKAALERAKRTAIEYIGATLGVGAASGVAVAVTPQMLQNFNFETAKWVILAWLANGVLQTVGSYIWAIKQGLPEADEDDFDDVAEGEDD